MEKRAFESHLGELGTRIRTLRFREGAYVFLAAALLGSLALMLADWRFQFPAAGRLLLGLGFLAVLLGLAVRTLRRTFRPLRPDYLAVTAEGESLAMENVMVNAVQFRELLAAEGRPVSLEGVSGPLIEEEFRLADKMAETVNLEANVSRETVRRRRRSFLVAFLLGAAGFWLGRDAALAILPRYFDPWGDHPPYSKSRFILEPRFATVDYGDSLDLSVRTEGERPREVQLLVREEGSAWRPVPLFVQAEDEYRGKIEAIEKGFEFRVHAYRARSHLGRVDVEKAPRVREVLVTYRYPPYTRLESRSEALADSGVEAVKKTELTFEAGSNRPLSGGSIALLSATGEARAEIPLATVAANRVSGAFSLAESGSFAIGLVDVDGRQSKEPLVSGMTVLPDGEPQVAIMEPEVFSLATPGIEIPIEVEAEDDFGVTAIERFATVDGEEREPERVEVNQETPNAYGTASFQIVPQELGAEPGSRIEMFARAWDNDPDGKKAGRSGVHTIRVITEDEYRQMLRQLMTAEDLSAQYRDLLDEIRSLHQEQQSLRERTEELARELERTDLDDQQREGLAAEAQDLAEEERLLAQKTESLAERMEERARREPVFDVEKQFNDLLKKHAEELARVGREPMPQAAESLVRPASAGAEGQAGAGQMGVSLAQAQQSVEKQKEAEESLRRMVGESEEEIAQALRRIEDVMRIYGDLIRLVQLYEAQKRVTAEAAPHRELTKAEGEALEDLRGNSSEEEDVWNGTVDVQEDLIEHAKALVDDASLAKVIPKVEAVARALDELYIVPNTGLGALHLARGKGKDGWDRAEAARQGFELLLEGECGKCQGSGACSSLCLALGQALGTGALPVPGLGMGMGLGQGLMGASGMGAAGGLGSAISQLAMNMQNANFGSPTSSMSLYGPETPQGDSRTRLSSRRKAHADTMRRDEAVGFADASREVMKVDKREHVTYLPGTVEGYAEEYERLVRDYFRVLAEEGR